MASRKETFYELLRIIGETNTPIKGNEFRTKIQEVLEIFAQVFGTDMGNSIVEVMLSRGGFESLQQRLNYISEVLNTKLDYSSMEWASFPQDLREIILGAQPMPIVGTDAVTTDTIVDKAVTPNKVSFINTVGSNILVPSETIMNAYVHKGKIIEYDGFWSTKLLKVKMEDRVRAINRDNQLMSFSRASYYDIDKNVIGELDYYDSSSIGTPLDININDARVNYIQFSFRNINKNFAMPNDTMIYLGENEKSFEEFSYGNLSEMIGLSESHIETIVDRVKNANNIDNNFSVYKSGDTIRIETTNGVNTLNRKLDIKGSANGTLNFLSTILNGSVIRENKDDITPFRLSSTVGANHGYTHVYLVTYPNHNFTDADLGMVLNDGSFNYVILKVDVSTLLLGKEYTRNADGTYSVNSSAMGTSLKKPDGTSITGYTSTKSQLYPSVKNVKTTHSELGAVDKFVINESYEILDYSTIYDWAKANKGKNYVDYLPAIDSIAKLSITYFYSGWGGCTINHSILFTKSSTVSMSGFLQSIALSSTAKRYMPDINIPNFDFKNGIDLGSYSTSLLVQDANLIDPTFPPIRYFDTTPTLNFSMGYIHDKGIAIPETRLENTNVFWDLRATKKSYPVAVDSKLKATAGTYLTLEGFRNYSLPEQDLTHFSEVEDGEAYYIYLDAHKEINHSSHKVSALIGSKIEVLRSEGFTLHNDYVSAEGITFSTESYAQAILKIKK